MAFDCTWLSHTWRKMHGLEWLHLTSPVNTYGKEATDWLLRDATTSSNSAVLLQMGHKSWVGGCSGGLSWSPGAPGTLAKLDVFTGDRGEKIQEKSEELQGD